jgi:hypothetical protein
MDRGEWPDDPVGTNARNGQFPDTGCQGVARGHDDTNTRSSTMRKIKLPGNCGLLADLIYE